MGPVLVTGAAGFIGSHLVDRLLGEGRKVVGVDCFTSYYARSLKLANLAGALGDGRFTLVEGDLMELDPDRLLRGVDGVAHLAGEPGVRQSWGESFGRYLERNVRTTQRLLEAVCRREVGRFVYASSSSVYGADSGGPVAEDAPKSPVSPYGVSKLAAEEVVGVYARERGVPATVLRYFTVYGPRQRPEMALSRFVSSAMEGRAVEVFGDGEQEREMTHVADVVEATAAALRTPVEGAVRTYNVGGGSRATMNELVERVESELGVRARVEYYPRAAGDARSTWADSGRARRELGFVPAVSLQDGMRDQVEYACAVGGAAGVAGV